jgi:hypothetical protein
VGDIKLKQPVEYLTEWRGNLDQGTVDCFTADQETDVFLDSSEMGNSDGINHVIDEESVTIPGTLVQDNTSPGSGDAGDVHANINGDSKPLSVKDSQVEDQHGDSTTVQETPGTSAGVASGHKNRKRFPFNLFSAKNKSSDTQCKNNCLAHENPSQKTQGDQTMTDLRPSFVTRTRQRFRRVFGSKKNKVVPVVSVVDQDYVPMRITDIDAKVFAQELAMLESEMFCRIELDEILDKKWKAKDRVSLKKLFRKKLSCA